MNIKDSVALIKDWHQHNNFWIKTDRTQEEISVTEALQKVLSKKIGSLQIDDFRMTALLGHLIVPRRRPVEI